ncbi:Xaa-Pro peptidase family protein [Bradyrhizobium sp. B097]|uniref:M24 family metallopeptidase n=1 Tax=Bradyrhizobium sp. B097 TaxID=3140244 RepID=UPI003182BE0E
MSTGLQVKAAEYESRILSLKQAMAEQSIDMFLITDQANFEYFSGYKSLFWISKARPMALLIPREDKAAIIVSSTVEALPLKLTKEVPHLVEHVTYRGFTPEFVDAVTGASERYNPKTIAIDYGFECFGLGSLTLVDGIKEKFPGVKLIEGGDCVWALRAVKSPTEIEQKKAALEVATSTFMECLADLRLGDTEVEFARRLTVRMIEKGASSVPWLPVRFGRGSFAYSLPPTDRALAADDFIWVDMGCEVNGSLSDVNRIAKAGKVTAEEQARYQEVRAMTVSTLSSLRAGMTGREAYEVFENHAQQSSLGLPAAFTSFASRVGHGSGSNLTEPPSISPNSDEILREGMIIHVEPKYEIDGGVYQVEEVAVITAQGADIITCVSPEHLPEAAI